MVPISGVYTVIHVAHRPQHETIAIRGEEFPSCRICKDAVRFCVAKVTPHMTHDFDLAGPHFPALKGRAKVAKRGIA
jgi:hypothetical protein